MSSDDPRKAAKRLNGHVGHLTPEQSEAFTAFKSILQKNNLYTSANEAEAVSKPSDDDATLLYVFLVLRKIFSHNRVLCTQFSRFLRARRWDPSKALKQFSDTATWRKKNDVDNLFANFDPEEFESSRRFYPRWVGRRDKVRQISAFGRLIAY